MSCKKKAIYNRAATNLIIPEFYIISSPTINASVREPSYVANYNYTIAGQYTNTTEIVVPIDSKQQQIVISNNLCIDAGVDELITSIKNITNRLKIMTIETKELQQSLQRISGITHNINNKASNIDLKIK